MGRHHIVLVLLVVTSLSNRACIDEAGSLGDLTIGLRSSGLLMARHSKAGMVNLLADLPSYRSRSTQLPYLRHT